MYIKDIMKTELFVLFETDKIALASDVMKYKKIRHIPIVNKNNELIGLITHRDLIGAMAKKLEHVPVKDIMKTHVTTVGPDTPLKGAIEIMILNKFGCLPVVNSENKLTGIVTETDLLQALYEMSAIPADFYKVK